METTVHTHIYCRIIFTYCLRIYQSTNSEVVQLDNIFRFEDTGCNHRL